MLLAVCSFAGYSQHVYRQELNQVATINFPDTPKATPTKVGIVYTLADSGRVYLAEASVIRKRFIDFFSDHFNDQLFAGVIEGSLKNTAGKIIYKKSIKVNGLDGIEFCYSAKIDSTIYYRYHQVFYLNNTLVFYGYWSSDSLRSDDKNLRSFFRTFKLTGKTDNSTALRLGYIAGKVFGVIIVIGLILLVGLGAIYIIRKMVYK